MNVAGGQLRRCYRHQRFPIAELNRTLRLAQTGRRQLFDVSLSFESLDGDDQFGGTSSRVITMDNGYEQTPMAIFVRDYHPYEDVHLDFNFNTAYYSSKKPSACSNASSRCSKRCWSNMTRRWRTSR
ncbi:hypothetical protein QNM99_19655 [Pseudomonas sp. PCH446]